MSLQLIEDENENMVGETLSVLSNLICDIPS